ncbi:MAG: glycosyltransferase family 39 protein [Caldilineaceae bacterium]
MPQLLYRLTGDNLVSVRWGATLYILLALPFFYLFARRLAGNGVAFLATLLIAVSPWYLNLDSSTLSAATIILAGSLAFWLLWMGYDRQQPKWGLIAGFVLGMAATDVVVCLGLLFWLLCFSS